MGGAAYRDVARESGKGAGVGALMRFMADRKTYNPPFALPFLKSGRLVMGKHPTDLHRDGCIFCRYPELDRP